MLSEDDIDLEEIESRLYSQVYHPTTEEPVVLSSEIKHTPNKTFKTKYSLSNTGYSKQNRYYGHVMSSQRNSRFVSNNSSTMPDTNLTPNIVNKQSLTIELPQQNISNSNSQNFHPAHFYGHSMGQISFPQFYSVVNPPVNNIIVLPQNPTEYIIPTVLNRSQRKQVKRAAKREEMNKIKAANQNAELFKKLSMDERKKVYKLQKRQLYMQRKRERKKIAKEQKMIDTYNLNNATPKKTPKLKNIPREVICLSDTDPEELKLIEEEHESHIISSDENSDETSEPSELCIVEEKDEFTTTNKIEPKDDFSESCSTTKDDIIFVEPIKVESIVLDVHTLDLETASVSSSVSFNSSGELKRKDLIQTTPKSRQLIMKDRELLSTPESASNDFLGTVELRANKFNFSLHGSDYGGSTEFLKPKSLGGIFESESSCSASDMSTPIKNIVFNEIEFDAPAKELFLDNNLESFSQFITPKRTNILAAIPSILSSSVDEFEQINTKATGTHKEKTYSDSSSESEYGENTVDILKKAKQDLPNLTPFDPILPEPLKNKKISEIEQLNCEKAKKKKHRSDDVGEVEVSKKKKKNRSEDGSQEDTVDELEGYSKKKKKSKSLVVVEELVQNEELERKEFKKKKKNRKEDIPEVIEEVTEKTPSKEQKKNNKSKFEAILNTEKECVTDTEGRKSPKESKKKKKTRNEDSQSVAEDDKASVEDEEQLPKKRKKTKSEQSEDAPTSDTGYEKKSKKKKKKDKKGENIEEIFTGNNKTDDENSQNGQDEDVLELHPRKSKKRTTIKSDEEGVWMEESMDEDLLLIVPVDKEAIKEPDIIELGDNKQSKTNKRNDTEISVTEVANKSNELNNIWKEEIIDNSKDTHESDDDDLVILGSPTHDLIVIDESDSDIENDNKAIDEKTSVASSSSSYSFSDFGNIGKDITLGNIGGELETIKINHAFGTSFADFWSEDMDKFYNTTWGQDNFNVLDAQRSMTDDPKKWEIIDRDRIRIHQNTPKAMRCRRCRQVGHIQVNCDRRDDPIKCHLCGGLGHAEPRCPNKLCTQCGRKSKYSTTFCSACGYLRNHQCGLCRRLGHRREYCPDLWRRYHLTTLDGPIIIPSTLLRIKEKAEVWCAGCAKSGHFEDECNYVGRMHHPTVPYVVEYTNIFDKTFHHSVSVDGMPNSTTPGTPKQYEIVIPKNMECDISKSTMLSHVGLTDPLTERISNNVTNNVPESQLILENNSTAVIVIKTAESLSELPFSCDTANFSLNEEAYNIVPLSILNQTELAVPNTLSKITNLESPAITDVSSIASHLFSSIYSPNHIESTASSDISKIVSISRSAKLSVSNSYNLFDQYVNKVDGLPKPEEINAQNNIELNNIAFDNRPKSLLPLSVCCDVNFIPDSHLSNVDGEQLIVDNILVENEPKKDLIPLILSKNTLNQNQSVVPSNKQVNIDIDPISKDTNSYKSLSSLFSSDGIEECVKDITVNIENIFNHMQHLSNNNNELKSSIPLSIFYDLNPDTTRLVDIEQITPLISTDKLNITELVSPNNTRFKDKIKPVNIDKITNKCEPLISCDVVADSANCDNNNQMTNVNTITKLLCETSNLSGDINHPSKDVDTSDPIANTDQMLSQNNNEINKSSFENQLKSSMHLPIVCDLNPNAIADEVSNLVGDQISASNILLKNEGSNPDLAHLLLLTDISNPTEPVITLLQEVPLKFDRSVNTCEPLFAPSTSCDINEHFVNDNLKPTTENIAAKLLCSTNNLTDINCQTKDITTIDGTVNADKVHMQNNNKINEYSFQNQLKSSMPFAIFCDFNANTTAQECNNLEKGDEITAVNLLERNELRKANLTPPILSTHISPRTEPVISCIGLVEISPFNEDSITNTCEPLLPSLISCADNILAANESRKADLIPPDDLSFKIEPVIPCDALVEISPFNKDMIVKTCASSSLISSDINEHSVNDNILTENINYNIENARPTEKLLCSSNNLSDDINQHVKVDAIIANSEKNYKPNNNETNMSSMQNQSTSFKRLPIICDLNPKATIQLVNHNLHREQICADNRIEETEVKNADFMQTVISTGISKPTEIERVNIDTICDTKCDTLSPSLISCKVITGSADNIRSSLQNQSTSFKRLPIICDLNPKPTTQLVDHNLHREQLCADNRIEETELKNAGFLQTVISTGISKPTEIERVNIDTIYDTKCDTLSPSLISCKVITGSANNIKSSLQNQSTSFNRLPIICDINPKPTTQLVDRNLHREQICANNRIEETEVKNAGFIQAVISTGISKPTEIERVNIDTICDTKCDTLSPSLISCKVITGSANNIKSSLQNQSTSFKRLPIICDLNPKPTTPLVDHNLHREQICADNRIEETEVKNAGFIQTVISTGISKPTEIERVNIDTICDTKCDTLSPSLISCKVITGSANNIKSSLQNQSTSFKRLPIICDLNPKPTTQLVDHNLHREQICADNRIDETEVKNAGFLQTVISTGISKPTEIERVNIDTMCDTKCDTLSPSLISCKVITGSATNIRTNKPKNTGLIIAKNSLNQTKLVDTKSVRVDKSANFKQLKVVKKSESVCNAILPIKSSNLNKNVLSNPKNINNLNPVPAILPKINANDQKRKHENLEKSFKAQTSPIGNLKISGNLSFGTLTIKITAHEALHFLYSIKAEGIYFYIKNTLNLYITVEVMNKKYPQTGIIIIKGILARILIARDKLTCYFAELAQLGDVKPDMKQIELMDKVRRYLDLIDKVDTTPQCALEKLKYFIALNKRNEIDECYQEINTIFYGKYQVQNGYHCVQILKGILDLESIALSATVLTEKLIEANDAFDYLLFKQRQVSVYEFCLASNHFLNKVKEFAELKLDKSKDLSTLSTKINVIPGTSSDFSNLENDLRIQPVPWHFLPMNRIPPYFLKQYSEINNLNVNILARNLHFISLSISSDEPREIELTQNCTEISNSENTTQVSKLLPTIHWYQLGNRVISKRNTDIPNVSTKFVIRSSLLTDMVLQMKVRNIVPVDNQSSISNAENKLSVISEPLNEYTNIKNLIVVVHVKASQVKYFENDAPGNQFLKNLSREYGLQLIVDFQKLCGITSAKINIEGPLKTIIEAKSDIYSYLLVHDTKILDKEAKIISKIRTHLELIDEIKISARDALYELKIVFNLKDAHKKGDGEAYLIINTILFGRYKLERGKCIKKLYAWLHLIDNTSDVKRLLCQSMKMHYLYIDIFENRRKMQTYESLVASISIEKIQTQQFTNTRCVDYMIPESTKTIPKEKNKSDVSNANTIVVVHLTTSQAKHLSSTRNGKSFLRSTGMKLSIIKDACNHRTIRLDGSLKEMVTIKSQIYTYLLILGTGRIEQEAIIIGKIRTHLELINEIKTSATEALVELKLEIKRKNPVADVFLKINTIIFGVHKFKCTKQLADLREWYSLFEKNMFVRRDWSEFSEMNYIFQSIFINNRKLTIYEDCVSKIQKMEHDRLIKTKVPPTSTIVKNTVINKVPKPKLSLERSNKNQQSAITEAIIKENLVGAVLNIVPGQKIEVLTYGKRKKTSYNNEPTKKMRLSVPDNQVFLTEIQSEYIFNSVEGNCFLSDLYEKLNVRVYHSYQFSATINGESSKAIFDAKLAIQDFVNLIKYKGFPVQREQLYRQLITQFARANVYYLTMDTCQLYNEILEIEQSIASKEYSNQQARSHEIQKYRRSSVTESNSELQELLSVRWIQLHSIILVKLASYNVIEGLNVHLDRLQFWKENLRFSTEEIGLTELCNIKDSFYFIFDCNRKNLDYRYCNNSVRADKILLNVQITSGTAQYVDNYFEKYINICRQHNFEQKMIELSMFSEYLKTDSNDQDQKHREALIFLGEVDLYLKEQGIACLSMSQLQ